MRLWGPWSLWMTSQLLLRHYDVTSAQSIVIFQRVGQCPHEVLSPGLRYSRFAGRSKVQCAALCLPDVSCRSFLFSREERVCYLGAEAAFSNCSNTVLAPSGLQHFDMVTYVFLYLMLSFFKELNFFLFFKRDNIKLRANFQHRFFRLNNGQTLKCNERQ